jgi:ABC-type multidrug transport system ATPase subunit
MKSLISKIKAGWSAGSGSLNLPVRLGFENITFGYGGEDSLFENVNFKFEGKGLVLFKGDNGIGKTTILKLLTGFVSPRTGKVVCEADGAVGYSSADGSDVNPYVTCDSFLSDCLCCGNAQDLKEVFNSLNLFGKEKYRGLELSSGQIKKLSVFRAIAKSRCCAFLDEPLSFLGYRFKNEIVELIKYLKVTMTILVIDHSKEFDKDANRIYEIRDKQIF